MKRGNQLLTGTIPCLRSICKTLRTMNEPYEIKQIEFKNFNSYFNGRRGIGISISWETYLKLHQ